MVQLKPDEGLQLYDVPPVAFNEILEPVQIDTLGPAFAVGDGFTVTISSSVSTQPLTSVTVTV